MGELLELLRKRLGSTSTTYLHYSISRLNETERALNSDRDWPFSFFSDGFHAKKTSSTLFLLGSGPSINSLTKDNFSEISRHDSLGFNSWLFHDFVPSFYLFRHCPKQPDWELANRILRQRAESYSSVELLFQGSRWSKCREALTHSVKPVFPEKEFWYVRDMPVHSKSRSGPGERSIEEIIEFVGHLGLLDFGKPARVLPQFGGTLGLLLPFAIQMGYSDVVLCGFDGKSLSHFYDDDAHAKRILESTGLSPYRSDQRKGTFLDKVTTRNNSVLLRYMRDKSQCKIWTSSNVSVFSDVAPVWRW